MAISLCHTGEIPESAAIGFNLSQANLFAVRKNGKIYLYLNRCPHLGTPLEWQKNQFLDAESQYIKCSTHGALFLMDSGECILGPCQGQSLWEIEYSIENNHIIIDEEELPAQASPA